MNKHVNKVRKATGRAKAITAGRQDTILTTIKSERKCGSASTVIETSS